MLEEAITKLEGMAVEAAQPRIIRDAALRRKFWLVTGNHAEQHEADPPVRKHTFLSLLHLVKRANEEAAGPSHPVIWHDDSHVRLLFDDVIREDVATFKLLETKQFELAKGLASRQFNQRDLVRVLRTTLSDSVDADLLPIVRKINFRATSGGTSEVQHGKESMDRSIVAELTGAGELPEQVVISCDLYQNLGEIDAIETSIEIPCAVEIDPDQQLFYLLPVPGVIEERQRHVGYSIDEWLRASVGAVPVYYGTP